MSLKNINIELTKGIEKTNTDSQEKRTTLIHMNKAMNSLCDELCVSNDLFSAKDTSKSIEEYIKKYDRILYACLSDRIFELKTTDENSITSLLTNVEMLHDYVNDSNYCVKKEKLKEDTRKCVTKISDHINLAIKQLEALKQSDDEYKAKFEQLMTPITMGMQKDMSAQLITLVGIFTALAFLVFGGISSLDNTFNKLEEPIFKLISIGCIWSIGITNMLFVFLFCVSKMTNLSFKSNEKTEATLFQKYPVVAWTNCILITILSVGLFGYYITANGFEKYIVEFTRDHIWILGIFGLVLLASILLTWYVVSKKTRYIREQ